MFARKLIVGMVLLSLAGVGVPAWGTTYYVDPNGSDNNNGSSWATAFKTIQKGINTATDGDIVEVNEGTYYEAVDFNGVGCTLTSTNPYDWEVVASTVIDGNGATNVVRFDSSETASSVLKGFTITGGTRGVYSYQSVPTIANCIIEDNSGSGVYCYYSGASVKNNIIRNNTSKGINVQYSTISVNNNIIHDSATGLEFSYANGSTVTNNTVVGNSSYGIKATYGSPTISNCIVWDCNDDLNGCSATYSCIQDGDSGTGNISSDPCFVDADANDFHIDVNDSPCVDAGDPNGDYSGQTDIDGDTRLMWTAVDIGADETKAYILYGMEIVSAVEEANDITLTTTGATYVLTAGGIDLYRRIDPNTNDYDTSNEGKGLKVASLTFDPSIGPLSIDACDTGKVVIDGNRAVFTFYSDSFFVMEANDSIDCNYTNLVPAQWNAPLELNDRQLDRIWIDGSGGSLHALLEGSPILSVKDVNTTCFTMSDSNKMGFMAFPPKKYDFEGLYGQNAKPFMRLLSSTYQLQVFSEPNYLNDNIANGFGIYQLWSTYYSEPNGNTWKPVLLDNGILGYKFNDANEQNVREFVQVAHSKGAKVIPYLFDPDSTVWNYPDGNHQSYIVTAQWMQEFQRKYNFDGWYIDSSDYGGLWDDYDFMRMVRASVGEGGIIYHHDSPDVWDGHGYRGLRAINVNTYVNHTLDGETTGWYWGRPPIAKEDQPNDPYFRYFVCGYGTSQAYGNYIWESYGHRVITLREICRMMGENLNGSSWTGLTTLFRPFYEKRKAEYLNDANVPFVPDVNWPIDSSTGWFRYASDVQVTHAIDSCDVVIEWTTDSNADSNVFYTSDSKWWLPVYTDTPVNPPVGSSDEETSHSVTMTGLVPSTTYEFRIKSSNGEPNEQEIIWSHVGTFTPQFPASWWKLDETSGTTAYDSIYTNNGTFNGDDPCWVADGLINGALDCNGVSDYMSVSGLDGAYTSSYTFSVAGWFKTTKTTGKQTIVGQWGQYNPSGYPPSMYWGWQVLVENKKVVARFGNVTATADITGTSDVNDGNWHHFALIYPTSSSNATLYVDANSEGTPAARTFDTDNTKFRIGDGSYEIPYGESMTKQGGPFRGTIDDVMLREKALSADEVQQLYDSGS